MAWPGQFSRLGEAAGGLGQCCFTAVIVGVTEVALETARQQVVPRSDSLRAYERVEWSKAELEGWLIQQAYEGVLRAMEAAQDTHLRALQAKTAIAELGGVGAAPSMPGHRWRYVLPVVTVRVLARGCPSTRFFAPTLGPILRKAFCGLRAYRKQPVSPIW